MLNARKGWWLTLRLAYSAFSAIAGLGAFIAFFFIYSNIWAGTAAIIACLLSVICLHLNILYYKETLDDWFTVNSLSQLQIIAVCGIASGLGSLGYSLFYAIFYSVPIMPVKDSYYITSVWCFWTFKMGASLFYLCRWYKQALIDDLQPLLGSTQ